jgi:cytoplasmic tRNA 2-thiolation protein 2
MSSISQGGGFVVREEAEEEWIPPREDNSINVSRRRKMVRISRPLRDVGMKECAAWAWWSGLRVIGRDKVPGATQGIGGLTKGGYFVAFSVMTLLPKLTSL